MSKPVKFGLHYTCEEIKLLENAAALAGYETVSKFILYCLYKRARLLQKKDTTNIDAPQKKKTIHIRVSDPEVLEKLCNRAQYDNQHVTIIIKRLVTDPILLEAMLAVVSDDSENPGPQSL